MNTVCCFDKISEKIKKVFEQKNKYPKVVAAARQAAKRHNSTMIVFQQGKNYHWTFEDCYVDILNSIEKQPTIRLLVCLPDGTVAQ